MEATKTFQDLQVWRESHKFVVKTYVLTKEFPKEEIFGLTSQFRRAAVSIAANIAEAYPKRGVADKLRFLNIAQASLEECRYYIILSLDLNYIKMEDMQNLSEILNSTSRLLNAYYKTIDKNSVKE
jgi:four helix bundle protein